MYKYTWTSLLAQTLESPEMQETQVWSLGWKDPLEKEMATYSSILAWRIPWLEEPGKLQSRVCKEPDMTEQLTLLFHRYTHTNTHTYHVSNRIRMNQDPCGIPVKFPSVHAYIVLDNNNKHTIKPWHKLAWNIQPAYVAFLSLFIYLGTIFLDCFHIFLPETDQITCKFSTLGMFEITHQELRITHFEYFLNINSLKLLN